MSSPTDPSAEQSAAPTPGPRSRPTGRVVWLVGLAVTLLVAAVVSYFASSHPDGLEFVAESTGFLDSGRDSATAGGPLSDYQTSGVDDPWLSGAVAGLIGCAAVLALMTGIALAVRRRR